MTFLPVVGRELKVSSRRPATYWLRFFLVLAALVIWFFLLVTSRASLPAAQRGQMLFVAMGVLALGFCLLAGVFLTADCVSEEKREGTLGLLFLTELKGYDVVLGKLMATSLHAAYGLLAVLPLLALPLLMGGVTSGEFWRVTLALILTLFLSLSVGMLTSAFSRETRQAMSAALMAMLFLTGILPALWCGQKWLFKRGSWDALLWFCPANLYVRAFDANYYGAPNGPEAFWCSLLTLAGLAGAALVLSSLHLPHALRQKEEEPAAEGATHWRRRWRFGTTARSLQRRLRLADNPVYWLVSRDRLPGCLVWSIVGPLFAIWLGYLAGCFSKSPGTKSMCFGVSMFVAYGLHQVLKFLVAIETSRRLSEDRRSGALELLLVTPISVEQILSGQRRALRRIFFGPMLLVSLTNVGLFWLLTGPNPLRMDSEAACVFCVMFLGGAVMLLVDFYALNWIGMWMAMRTKRHHRAVLATLARAMLVSWLAILFFILMASAGGSGQKSAEAIVLTVLWCSLGAVVDFMFATRAKVKLLLALRETSPQAQGTSPDLEFSESLSTPKGASL